MTEKIAALEHLTGCPEARRETYEALVDNLAVTTTRCIDCGAHLIERADAPRYQPGSDEWERLWVDNPAAVAAGLTDEERKLPDRNPLHPLATSWPPTSPPRQRTFIDDHQAQALKRSRQ
jgi:hypothetical protein